LHVKLEHVWKDSNGAIKGRIQGGFSVSARQFEDDEVLPANFHLQVDLIQLLPTKLISCAHLAIHRFILRIWQVGKVQIDE